MGKKKGDFPPKSFLARSIINSSSLVNLDNNFNGWIRYTMGLGRMMEEPPAISNMCYAEYQGWVNGTHPEEKDGVVKRQVNSCFYH